jgi:hypothetical protein
MANLLNARIAARLDEVARLLEQQGADRFRVRAYVQAAQTVRQLSRPVSELLDEGGLAGLDRLRGIGPVLARAIRALAIDGRLPMLDRLRGAVDPVALLASVPGIGRTTAGRLHHDLGLDSLEDLELAAHDGRLQSLAGFGAKRLAGVRDSLAHRLGRVRGAAAQEEPPPVGELLDVDAEYRAKVAAGALPLIAPRRFNATGAAWLPVLHTTRGARRYTALFSNTPRAHRLGTTRDWVVLYHDGASAGGQATVVTAKRGALAGQRVVAGREDECGRHRTSEPVQRAVSA